MKVAIRKVFQAGRWCLVPPHTTKDRSRLDTFGPGVEKAGIECPFGPLPTTG